MSSTERSEEVFQKSRHQKGDIQQVPFRGPKSINRHRKKFQSPWRPHRGISAAIYFLFKNSQI
jgi:hypothetical protein